MGVLVEVGLPSQDEVDSLAGDELDAVLLELERVARRVEAARLAVIDRADRDARFLADGHRSTAAWVRAVTNCSPATSRRRAQAARALRDLPRVGEALGAGEVGVDQVHELARLHSNPRCGDLVAGSELVLLRAARELE